MATITPELIKRVKQRYGIIGESATLIEAIRRALVVAPIDMSVLIIGESGTGKEVFPKLIHENSPRKHKRYIAVNCGAIPEGTIDSELFGHVKGAFTDATSDHKGYFEVADGGVIFLDEVAEMPLSTQARLLRVLESGEYLRVGSSEVRRTDLRVVAATNKDLQRAVQEGKFREDLFYRLSTVQIDLPPLRERGHDISLLTRKFMHDFANEHNTPDVELTPDAKQALERFGWPGNVRQLKNVVERIALYEAGTTVSAATLRQGHYLPMPQEIVVAGATQHDYNIDHDKIFSLIGSIANEVNLLKQQLTAMAADGSASRPTTAAAPVHIASSIDDLRRGDYPDIAPGGTLTFEYADYDATHAPRRSRPIEHVTDAHTVVDVEPAVKTLDQTERETIEEALHRNGGRRKKTAQELNISERTLYRKLKQYRLEHEAQS